MRSGLKLVLALGACASASGCVAAGAVAGAGMLAAQERTVGQAIDDAYASTAIKAKLLAADRAFQRIDVEVAQGRVLLTGPAPTAEHRVLAERVAWSAPSVEAVANEIIVGPRSGFLRSARDELISAQVRARLVSSTAVRAIDFNVETHDGVVYLMGLARSEDEARIAAEAASRVGGVERVISYIVTRPPRPDFSLGAPAPQAAPAYAQDHAAADAAASTPSPDARGAPLFPRN